ncbi:helix-turn-helix domain-containing protein [Rhodopila sp.]|uniref:helix-turn-helix domain-containing protein n=1 Tax=Rhodopila sp. TaxID=2480087 RepID=UPI002D7E8562|nr:helix-turn-helix domain-containing protein [Rhodopila sp.]
MDERVRFLARLLDGESMSDLCREAGTSRKTGYKILKRYKEEGVTAISDRSRRPDRYANRLPPQLEAMIVGLKKDKPHWGARKLRERLLPRLPNDIKPPAVSTIHAVLDRNRLVSHQGRARRRAEGTKLSAGAAPNDLWCADFKGEFRLGNGQHCDPLTVTDHASRYLLLCEALASVREDPHHRRLRALVPRARLAGCHPLRQRRALRQPERPSSISPSSHSGGCASASPSSASSQAIRSKTAATSVCT